jgi:uncharacterized membrane protein (UPF0136 family)
VSGGIGEIHFWSAGYLLARSRSWGLILEAVDSTADWIAGVAMNGSSQPFT